MKAAISVTCVLLLLCLVVAFGSTPQEVKPKREKFSALAYLPSGAGRAMVGAGATANVDLYVNSYTDDAEAKALAGVLVQGGPDALHKALEKTKSKGKITLSGRVGFYDLKLIRSRRTENGRRIYAVGDRPIRFLEAYVSNRSRDYEFGILQLDLKQNSDGKEEGAGALIYAAKIKLLDGNTIDVENYGIEPVRLMAVRRL
jgi:hypothetical protein